MLKKSVLEAKIIKVKDFILKLKEIGFNDDTEIEFDFTDYENSYGYEELEVDSISSLDNECNTILVDLKW